jgi:tetratricopeptide (TPR) repeat protein
MSSLRRKQKGKKQEKAKRSVKSISQLIADAESLLDECNPEEAAVCLDSALAIEPRNTTALDLLGQALMDMGEAERAFLVFKQSTEIAPHDSHLKWMYMGQMQAGKEAVTSFQSGTAVLQNKITQLETAGAEQSEIRLLKQQLASGLCSVSEIYTTDLCDEPNAEAECERCLTLALASFENHPESLYALANLRFLQQNTSEAIVQLDKCIAVLRHFANQADEGERVVNAAAAAVELVAGSDEMPNLFQVRSNAAKLCLELGKFSEAIELFEDALAENEFSIEIWYFAGMAYLGNDEPHYAVEYLTEASRLLEKTQQEASEDLDTEERAKLVSLSGATQEMLQRATAAAALCPAPKDPTVEPESDEEPVVDQIQIPLARSRRGSAISLRKKSGSDQMLD